MFSVTSDIDIVGLSCINYKVSKDELKINIDIGYILINHTQEWCENVSLVETDGLECLVNSVITEFEINVVKIKPQTTEQEYGLYEATFIKIHTTKGIAHLRFTGESNGYYSVSADYNIYVDNCLLFDSEIDYW